MTRRMVAWLLTRVPGVVVAVGLGVIVALGVGGSLEAFVLLAAALIVALVPHRDVLGISVATLLGAAAFIGSTSAMVVAGGAVAVALVLRQLLAGRGRDGVGAWLVVGAMCVGLALGPLTFGAEVDEAVSQPSLTNVEGDTVQRDTVQLDSVQLDSVQLDSVQLDSVQLAIERQLLADAVHAPALVPRVQVDVDRSVIAQLNDGGGVFLGPADLRSAESDQRDSTSWWLAVLTCVLGVVSLRTLTRFRRLDLALVAAAEPHRHVERFEQLGRHRGVARKPGESILQYAERLADEAGDPRLLQLGGLISAELYGEASSRRSDTIERLIDAIG